MMRGHMSPRSLVLWLGVSLVAIGVSVRPRPLESSDLYDHSPAYSGLPDRVSPPLSSPGGTENFTVITRQPDAPRTIGWSLLRTLNYNDGTMHDELRKLNGKRVRIPGFIVPLDDFQDVVKEFLLVPYFGACVHTPPPPPNQLVYVGMRGKQKVSLFEPVWIEGVLSIRKYQSIYGAVGFQMSAERISPYR